MEFWLDGFPMPPSINEQLMSVRGRLIKTKKAREFDKQVNEYCRANRAIIKEIKKELTPALAMQGLKIDCFFAFHEDRLVTKTKKAKDWLKVLDANNRLKSTLDGISKALEIDDKFFIAGNCEKVSCKSLEDQRVLIRIKPQNLKNLEAVLFMMKLNQ
jgi:hypothetical protein